MSKYFLQLLFLWPFLAFAETGVELVRQKMPELYQAVVQQTDSDTAEKFFKGWTETELAIFRTRVAGLFSKTSPTLKRVPSGEFLYSKYGGEVFGVMGEAFGTPKLRDHLKPGEKILDEIQYGQLNPYGNRPDGLSYQLQNDRLVIQRVLESKMGFGGYSKAQAEGYLNFWKKNGIQVWGNRGAVHIPSDQIFFSIQGKEIPISKLTLRELQTVTLLIASEPNPDFPGEVVTTPFRTLVARKISHSFTHGLVHERQPTQGRENVSTPVLETPEEVEEYRRQLSEWILLNQRWPKSSGDSPLERYFAYLISRRGGQSSAFVQDLTGEMRYFIGQYGQMPALSSLFNQLRNADPNHPNVQSALRAYIRYYGLDAATPLIHNPAWRDFLAQNPMRRFLTIDPREQSLCVDLILRIPLKR